MDKNSPRVKMFMQYKKPQLIILAKERNLSTEGYKLDLAIRLAKDWSKRMEREYAIISGRIK